MKKHTLGSVIALLLMLPATALAAPKSEISVSADGKVTIKNLHVVQVAGRSYFARAEWDDISLKMLVRTDANTKITKHFKGTAQYGDILQGHYLNVEGHLNSSSDTFDVVASSVQDVSLDSDVGTFSGTVTAVNTNANTLTLATKTDGVITVSLGNAPTITRGSLNLTLSLVGAGDKILAATGSYDFPTKTLTANGITIFQDPAQFTSRTFTGTFKSAEGTSLPTSLIVTINGKDYTVRLGKTSSVLTGGKKPVVLSRFVTGDPLRIYGKRVESLDPIIEAEVVRNTNL